MASRRFSILASKRAGDGDRAIIFLIHATIETERLKSLSECLSLLTKGYRMTENINDVLEINKRVCQIVCVTDYGVGTLPSKRMAN